MSAVTVDLRTRTGVTAGTLAVTPASRRATGYPPQAEGSVVEGAEYFVTIDVPGGQVTRVDPEELVLLDPHSLGGDGPVRGRLRTGNTVGPVEVTVHLVEGTVLHGWLEVRSTKLDHNSQYQWMLSSVAQDGAELLMRTYAPSVIDVAADHTAGPKALYQQLAFLSAILQRPHTVEAVERVLRSPHVSYVDTTVDQPIGRGVPGSSAAVRAMTRPGRRVRAPAGLTIDTVPERVEHARTHATVDNPPNRFVRFVLDHWATVLDQAGRVLTGDTAEHRRGRRELAHLSELVEHWATDRRLRDVGRLTEMPHANQVITRRPGYREVHQAFLESRAAAMLQWDGGDDLNRAGQQDIAQLYEYWCFLQLRRLVAEHCDHVDSSPLVEVTGDGLHLRLRQGRQRAVNGFLTRHGRLIDVELWFNRSFAKGTESWSMQLRPDCSISFEAQTAAGGSVRTWVHFDAKYRVNSATELFVDDDAPVPAKRDDLIKMHAYRDAIRHSAGSYVLFPGDQSSNLREHNEILPGLGAFAFVPASDGNATAASATALSTFLDELIDHVAQQATNRERSAWWDHRIHGRPPVTTDADYYALTAPPADTTLLLGYYRSPEHLAWINRTGLYNLRLGDRRGAVAITGAEAGASTLLLWSRNHPVIQVWTLATKLEVLDATEMSALGYPRPPTGRYLCRSLAAEQPPPPGVHAAIVEQLCAGHPAGAPVATTWADLLGGL